MSASRRQRLLAWCWLGIRCARLVVVLPIELRRATNGSRRLVEAYRRTVEPITRRRVASELRRSELDRRLIGWAVQGGYLIDSYAKVAARTDAQDIAVAAASFMRLYDDLLESPGAPSVGARLSSLFGGIDIEAESDVEAILVDLFHWLAARVSEQNHELLYQRLGALHKIQLEVVDEPSQRDPNEVLDLTVRKGGAAMVILGGLVSPSLDATEVAVLDRLGGLLQLIDDFDDAFEDRAVLTSANWTRVPYGALAAELRTVSRALLRRYGPQLSRPFIDGLYSWLVLVGFRHLLDRSVRRWTTRTSVPRTGIAMVAFRKQHIR